VSLVIASGTISSVRPKNNVTMSLCLALLYNLFLKVCATKTTTLVAALPDKSSAAKVKVLTLAPSLLLLVLAPKVNSALKKSSLTKTKPNNVLVRNNLVLANLVNLSTVLKVKRKS
jgi:hypothetical protein